MSYVQHFQTCFTPQTQPIPGKPMVKNSAGGYAFQPDDWALLDRFLILGAEGNTYYADAKEHAVTNCETAARCLKADGVRTVNRAAEISQAGRALKNSPAIFVLAMAAGTGDAATKNAAYAALPKICRIPTHLFEFVQSVQGFRGWGRSLRRAIAAWYDAKDAKSLLYTLTKYPSRVTQEGQKGSSWCHRDVLLKAHVKFSDPIKNAVARRIVKGDGDDDLGSAAELFHALREVKSAVPKRLAELVREHNLAREHLPTEALSHIEIWDALLDHMPPEAMVRNLGKMTAIGLAAAFSDGTKRICATLSDADKLKKARLHPLRVLIALKQYAQGKGDKGSLAWSPVSTIVEVLDAAFYDCFNYVEPTGKNFVVGLDVSGSMSCGKCAGAPLTPCEGTAVMAMTIARTEKSHQIFGFAHEFRELGITSRDSLPDAIRKCRENNFGGTDCALPIAEALRRGWEVDCFVTMTDNETWAGKTGHPSQWLAQYRNKTGHNAKNIVCGMVANKFSVADPSDPYSLDVCGFDTNFPALVSGFAAE